MANTSQLCGVKLVYFGVFSGENVFSDFELEFIEKEKMSRVVEAAIQLYNHRITMQPLPGMAADATFWNKLGEEIERLEHERKSCKKTS